MGEFSDSNQEIRDRYLLEGFWQWVLSIGRVLAFFLFKCIYLCILR